MTEGAGSAKRRVGRPGETDRRFDGSRIALIGERGADGMKTPDEQVSKELGGVEFNAERRRRPFGLPSFLNFTYIL
jgi:hypothetical protein